MATRWLTDDEQRAWRAYLTSTVLLFDALDRQLTRDARIPHTYYEILVRLSEAPGRRLRMASLATASQSSRSRLSHAVSRLEERGWIRREEVPGDGRGLVAVLTDEGFRALEATAPGHVQAVRENFFDLLTPEQVGVLGEIGAAVTAKLGPGPDC